jgi:cytochrome c
VINRKDDTECVRLANGRSLSGSSLSALAYGPDGRLWIADGPAVRVLPPGVTEAPPLYRSPGDDVVIRALAVGSRMTLVGRRDGRVDCLDPGGRLLASRPVTGPGLTRMVLAADEATAAAGTEGGDVTVFDPADVRALRTFSAHRGAVTGLGLRPGGGLVTAGADRTIRLWSADGTVQMTLRASGPIRKLAVSADGRRLTFLAEGERGLRRWHLGTLAARLHELGIDPGY